MGRLLLVTVAATALLAACTDIAAVDNAAMSPLGSDFGNAVRHNEAAHVIDPRPAAADGQAPALDGIRAAAAMTRYQHNAVRELELEHTSDRQVE